MMTNRLTIYVTYILDAQNNRKIYFETDIQNCFENRTKKTKDMGKNVKHKNSQKPAKNEYNRNVLKSIMLLNKGNVVKKFHTSIFYRSRENLVSLKTFKTYGQTDISNYRVASLLKIIFNSVAQESFLYFQKKNFIMVLMV